MKQNKYFTVTTLILIVMTIIASWSLNKETDYASLYASAPQVPAMMTLDASR